MRRWNRQVTIGIAALISILFAGARAGQRVEPPVAQAGTRAAVCSALPLRFEKNIGQTAPGVDFVARGRGARVSLSSEGATFSIDTAQGSPTRLTSQGAVSIATFTMRLADAVRGTAPEGLERQQGRSNYLIGNDPARWVKNVPSFARVRYPQVYDGVDLIYYGSRGELEYDFVVAPGADPSRITLEFNGIDKLETDQEGDLVVATAAGLLRQRRPRVYQDIAGHEREIAGRYRLCGKRRAQFELADYDPAATLRIDPAVSYFTYVGGSGFDLGTGIAVDATGAAYVTGLTDSLDLPVTNSSKLNLAGVGGSSDAFVAKVNPGGSLAYATYLGGSNTDVGIAIAVDGLGSAYVTGFTVSSDFPVFPVAAPLQKLLNQNGNGGFFDAFIVKLDPSGQDIVYSTYFGGGGDETGRAIVVDSTGSAYVAGYTTSDNLVTQSVVGLPIQQHLAGQRNAFVLRLNAMGNQLMYSTYLGGSIFDEANGIAVDAGSNAYITGDTDSPDFPAQNCLGINRGGSDVFVTKIDANGAKQLYSSLLGGTKSDGGSGIAIDKQGNAYVTGATFSDDFLLRNPFQPAFAGLSDAFVAKLGPSGCDLKFATYLGGSFGFGGPNTGNNSGSGIAVNPKSHRAVVVGTTDTNNFPVTLNAFQKICGCGGSDAFVAEYDAGGQVVLSSYLGGTDIDQGAGIALDSHGAIFVSGMTVSSQFVKGTFTPVNTLNLGMNKLSPDAFVAEINP